MVDGGVFANNPAMCAYVAARRIYPDADNYLIVSLGTGALVKSYTYEQVAGWGIAGWAQPLLDIMFSGVSDTTSYQLDQLAPEVTQYRFQTDLTGASEAMDDVTPENLAALVKVATNTLNFNQKLMGNRCQRERRLGIRSIPTSQRRRSSPNRRSSIRRLPNRIMSRRMQPHRPFNLHRRVKKVPRSACWAVLRLVAQSAVPSVPWPARSLAGSSGVCPAGRRRRET
jgi:hypothetical protein